MDDAKVIPVVPELQRKKAQSNESKNDVEKPEIDWIEGDDDFDLYHDDVDWCE